MTKKRKNKRDHYAKSTDGLEHRSQSDSTFVPVNVVHSSLRKSRSGKEEKKAKSTELILPEYQEKLGTLRKKLAEIDRQIAIQEESGQETSLDLLRQKAEVKNEIIDLRSSVHQKIREPIINDIELKQSTTVLETRTELILDKQAKISAVEEEIEEQQAEEQAKQLAIESQFRKQAQKSQRGKKASDSIPRYDRNSKAVLTQAGSRTYVFTISSQSDAFGKHKNIKSKSRGTVNMPDYFIFQPNIDRDSGNSLTTDRRDEFIVQKQRETLHQLIRGANPLIKEEPLKDYIRSVSQSDLNSIFEYSAAEQRSGDKNWRVVALKDQSDIKVKTVKNQKLASQAARELTN